MDHNFSLGETLLHNAVKGKYCVKDIQRLLHQGHRPDIINDQGYAALHYAVTHPNADQLVRLFVEDYAADVDIEDFQGRTPLHILLEQSSPNFDVALELMRCGANVSSPRLFPLHLAVINKNCPLKVIKELIKCGADVNKKRLGDDLSPLHLAVADFRLDVVNELLANGAQVNIESVVEGNILHYALGLNFKINEIDIDNVSDVLKELSKHGVNLEALNFIHETPLIAFLSCFSTMRVEKSWKIVKVLLDLGANVHAMDGSGGVPLLRALIVCPVNQLLLKELLEHGADPFQKYAKWTVFQEAMLYYKKGIPIGLYIKMMIKYMLLNEEFFELIKSGGIHTFLPNGDFHQYTNDCFHELVNAKTIEVFDNLSLHMFLVKSVRNRSSCPKDSALMGKLLTLLAEETCPIYSDFITSQVLFERELLFTKLKELPLFTKSSSFNQASVNAKKVILNYDCVCQLSKYLPDYDALCLTVAYFVSYVGDIAT